MKARSPKLAQYLEHVGALDSADQDAIARAKAAYRKAYKTEHKRKNAKKHHELRPQFSDAEYGIIKEKAQQAGLTPTAYIKAIALADTGILPHRETLQKILQTVSMVAIRLEKDNHPYTSYASQAETALTEYLKQN